MLGPASSADCIPSSRGGHAVAEGLASETEEVEGWKEENWTNASQSGRGWWRCNRAIDPV
jgi:hypothetical protein